MHLVSSETALPTCTYWSTLPMFCQLMQIGNVMKSQTSFCSYLSSGHDAVKNKLPSHESAGLGSHSPTPDLRLLQKRAEHSPKSDYFPLFRSRISPEFSSIPRNVYTFQKSIRNRFLITKGRSRENSLFLWVTFYKKHGVCILKPQPNRLSKCVARLFRPLRLEHLSSFSSESTSLFLILWLRRWIRYPHMLRLVFPTTNTRHLSLCNF